MLATIVGSVTTILTFAGIFYYIAAMWSARSFVRRRARGVNPLKPKEGLNGAPSEFAPGVSILKPVRGLDPGMYEAFASHCRQEYACEYEILFGVSSLDDPHEAAVIEAIRRLQAEFPERSIRLVHTPEKLGPNGKMGNVVQLAREARYEHLLVNDSDIRVGTRYLERIMREFGAALPTLRLPTPTSEQHARRGPRAALRMGHPDPSDATSENPGISPLKPTEGLNGAPSSTSTQANRGLEWATRRVGLVTAPYRGQAHATLGSKLEALGISTDFFPGVLVS